MPNAKWGSWADLSVQASVAAWRLMPFLAASLALLIGTAGCGEEGAQAEGFSHLPHGVLEEDLRIGDLGEDAYAFSTVSQVLVGPDGTMYSLHFGEPHVRVWAPDGTAAGTMGREGDGPGEFQRPSGMGFLGDILWVLDLDGYRFNLFDPEEGEFLESLTPRVDISSDLEEDSGLLPPRPRWVLADGSLAGRTPSFANLVREGEITRERMVRMDREGEVLNVLAERDLGRSTGLVLQFEGVITSTSQPFNDGTIMEVSPDGTRIHVLERPAPEAAEEARFRLLEVGLEGDTLGSWSFPYRPEPVRAA